MRKLTWKFHLRASGYSAPLGSAPKSLVRRHGRSRCYAASTFRTSQGVYISFGRDLTEN